jgi:hypothetical protein
MSTSLADKSDKIYKKIATLHKKLTGDKELPHLTYFHYSDKNKFIGYTCMSIDKKKLIVDWIYAPKNGIEVMNSVLQLAFIFDKEIQPIDEMILKVSIDPTEKKDTVMKRVNFYIKCNFRVYDIQFRKKYGPLLFMKRNIWKNNKINYIFVEK